MADKLPPLPGSDEISFKYNKYDGYYKIKAREFWGKNVIEQIPDEPTKKCEHDFIKAKDGFECKKCHFGLIGPFKIKKGKLFFGGKQLPI